MAYYHRYHHNHVIFACCHFHRCFFLHEFPRLLFTTLLLLLLLFYRHEVAADSAEMLGIEVSHADAGDVVQDHSRSESSTNKPIHCFCDTGTKRTNSNCTKTGTCQSVSGCCRINIWYHHQTKNLTVDLPGCSVSPGPAIYHDPHGGGHDGDAIFVMICCGDSGCNKFNEPDVHKFLIPKLCNYTNQVHDINNELASFREFCQEEEEGKSSWFAGRFTMPQLILFLATSLAVVLSCAGVVAFVYTRRVNHCSVKQFLTRLFAGPKCWCVRYSHHCSETSTVSSAVGGRHRSRNSDTSVQQPLFEIVSTHNPSRCDNNSVNISVMTDSGFSNGGRHKKMSDSQGSRTTQTTSSLPNSNSATTGVGFHRCLLTSSFSTTSSGNNNLAGVPVLSPRSSQQPPMELNCETIGEVTNSGSGAGIPSLGTRTMACQIQLREIIGRGRYGVVHRGEMFCDAVAVKIFQSRDERAWLRERQIYTTHGMQHEQILAFRGADSKDAGLSTELWLVTEFHPNGSLFDFLSQRTVDLQMGLKLLYSLVCGLAHLHLEINGTPGKPAIAHRDLKSRNVLIKANLTCCLADFGFAVTYTSASNQLEQSPASYQCCVGTRRYMSNEILDKTLDCENFTSFTAADLYALGLVMWEILRRTELDPIAMPADKVELPYMEFGIGVDPSHADIHRVVCVEKKRPTIPPRFCPTGSSNNSSNNEATKLVTNDDNYNQLITSTLGKLTEELWQEAPTSRPTALQVKKLLLRFIKK